VQQWLMGMEVQVQVRVQQPIQQAGAPLLVPASALGDCCLGAAGSAWLLAAMEHNGSSSSGSSSSSSSRQM
jgi:hypothetical protein